MELGETEDGFDNAEDGFDGLLSFSVLVFRVFGLQFVDHIQPPLGGDGLGRLAILGRRPEVIGAFMLLTVMKRIET